MPSGAAVQLASLPTPQQYSAAFPAPCRDAPAAHSAASARSRSLGVRPIGDGTHLVPSAPRGPMHASPTDVRPGGEWRKPVSALLQASSPGVRPVGNGISLREARLAALLIEVGVGRVADAELVTCMLATIRKRDIPEQTANQLDSKIAMELQLRYIPSWKKCD